MFDLMPLRGRDRSLWGYLDNLERAFFQTAQAGSESFGQIRVDIADAGDKFLLSAELPGFDKDDIRIDVDAGRLTIRAEHKEESEEKDGTSYLRRERRYGSFARSFDISGIDADAIAAEYKNGVLGLTLPKLEAKPIPPTRQIEIQ